MRVIERQRGGFIRRNFLAAIFVAIAAVTAFWAAYIHFRSAVLPYDDAFIAYRYVENFTHAKGLVYNVGERAWGESTATYIFWLSTWHGLLPSVPLPELAVRTNVIPFVAVGVAVFFLVLRYSGVRPFAALAAGLVLMNPALLGISTGGMEPVLFMAFALLSLLAAAADKPGLAGLLAGLSLLTRVEGVVLAPILFLCFCRRPKSLTTMVATMASLPAAWGAFAWSYYGTLVPLSIVAKNRPLYALKPLTASFAIARNLDVAFSCGGGGVPGLLVLLLILICTIGCFINQSFRARGAWTVPLFFWGIFGMYSYGNPLMFEWYWPLLLVPALVTAVLGVSASFALLARSQDSRKRLAACVMAGLWAVWMMVANVQGWTLRQLGANDPNWSVAHIDTEPGRLRYQGYREAAAWLNRQRKPRETVLAPEIGALGFYLNGKLIDACGLVSPEAIPYLPVPPEERLGGGVGSIPLALVRDLQPDFIVTMPVFAQKNVLDDPWARRTYHTVAEFTLSVPVYGSDRVLILKHAPSPPGATLQTSASRRPYRPVERP